LDEGRIDTQSKILVFNVTFLMIVLCYCQQVKCSGVTHELPRVGVTEDGEVQVVRDSSGDVHVYAKSADDVMVHRKKTDFSKVVSFCPSLLTSITASICFHCVFVFFLSWSL